MHTEHPLGEPQLAGMAQGMIHGVLQALGTGCRAIRCVRQRSNLAIELLVAGPIQIRFSLRYQLLLVFLEHRPTYLYRVDVVIGETGANAHSTSPLTVRAVAGLLGKSPTMPGVLFRTKTLDDPVEVEIPDAEQMEIAERDRVE